MRKIAILLFILCLQITGFSQFTVTKVTNSVNTAQTGMFYSLPQTVIKIDLTLERIDRKPGPLADFAGDFLGTTNVIESNNSFYNLLDADISTLAEPDADQVYYLQFPSQKSKDGTSTNLTLSRIGTLLSFNATNREMESVSSEMNVNQSNYYFRDAEDFRYFADYNRKKVVDTIVRKITIDTVTIDRFLFRTSWASLSESDKANQAAMKIQSIREQRFNLLTGYQEVNYSGSIEYMDHQLKRMEDEYLQLFLGKETRSVETVTVYVLVKQGDTSKVVFDAGNGQSVQMDLIPHGNTSAFPEKPLQKQNHLYYRIPELTTVNITYNKKVFKSVVIPVSQFGKLAMAPLDGTQLYFNPSTGELVKMVKEQ